MRNIDCCSMTNHLMSCLKKQEASAESSKRKPKKTKVFHIVVEGYYRPDYWMHLDVPVNATLQNLDGFLRGIWLECCGHMSAFTIEGQDYSASPFGGFDDESMDVELGDVLSSKMKFSHEYDFGTTTVLALRVVSERKGEIKDEPITILARNEPPPITCDCGKLATQVCTECLWEGEGWLCDECAAEHECGEEMLLPVVNSPRVGMCAYVG